MHEPPVNSFSSTDDNCDGGSTPLPATAQPQNWRKWRKWTYIGIVGYCECLTFLVSMMLAPSVPQVLEEFNVGDNDKALGSFSVTVYILGFCVGPLLLGPLTDLYGRTFIYRLSILCFLLLTIGCALAPSISALIICRFFAGCFGGAPMAIGGAVVADMYPPGARDGPLAFYAVGTMMGPTLGPVLGGVITGSLGWRWVFWFASILAGVGAMGLFLLLPETHLPTLIKRHHRPRSLTRWAILRSRAVNFNISRLVGTVKKAVMLPARLSTHIPVLGMLVLICIFNGLVNMILSSLGSVIQARYKFPSTTAGLSYLGIGIGGLGALAVTKKAKALVTAIFTARGISDGPATALLFMATIPPITSAGLLIYGWTLQKTNIWILPIIGLFFFGFGYMSTRLSTQIFLVEAVPNYTASALAAHTIASSVGGALIPLSTFPLYDAVGYGWGNSIMALINLSLCVIPVIMYIYWKRTGDNRALQVHLGATQSPSVKRPPRGQLTPRTL